MSRATLMACILLWSVAHGYPAQAQASQDVSVGVFGLELLVGSLATVGGMVTAKMVPLGPAEMLGGVLAATASVGAVGLLMGANGNWLLAVAGGFGGWFLSDFFGAGIFGLNATYRLNLFTNVQLTSRDALFMARAIGTAFGVTIGFNLYR